MPSLESPRTFDLPTRRDVLRRGFAGLGLFAAGASVLGCGDGARRRSRQSNIADLGPLAAPDDNGVRLPAGFQSRIVARTGERASALSGYEWHRAPDGGATFSTDDGGWIYVSNSEYVPGGVGALRFSASGDVVDSYSILSSGSIVNCAGGPTPWRSWITCEEFERGRCWECDPWGIEAAVPREALGVFRHEAVAVDPAGGRLYLTEDERDGRLYRFTPQRIESNGALDLSAGVLEVARVVDEGGGGLVEWLAVPDPQFTGDTPTRLQVPESSAFRGGEGIWHHDGFVYFTTKGDNRVWALDTHANVLSILYDDDNFEPALLTGVDNVTVSPAGDVLVAEDGGDMQIVAIAVDGSVVPILQITGHPASEITGPAFDPSGTRLYFSSQRGSDGNIVNSLGITYEVSGPFFV